TLSAFRLHDALPIFAPTVAVGHELSAGSPVAAIRQDRRRGAALLRRSCPAAPPRGCRVDIARRDYCARPVGVAGARPMALVAAGAGEHKAELPAAFE